MKYIQTFLDKFKKNRHSSKEKLYLQISENERDEFIKNHKKTVSTSSDMKNISEFIKNNKEIKGLVCKNQDIGEFNIHMSKTITKFEPIKKFYYEIKQASKGFGGSDYEIRYLEKTWYKIKCFEDEWYICTVCYASGGYSTIKWIFKCDTLGGIKQLLLRYYEFNDIGNKKVEI